MSKRTKHRNKIAVIPDTQVKPGVKISHLKWAGEYIKDRNPDYIVHLGDHWDFPSLSTHDDERPLLTEGQDFQADVEAGNNALELLTNSLKGCKAKRIILRGNHENRMEREREKQPRKLRSLFSESLLNDRALGWRPIPYLEIIKLYGVYFSHYFYNPNTGRAYGGKAQSILNHVGGSFVMGHRQGLDVGSARTAVGDRRRGVIAGSFYQHKEKYLGPQSNEWRGILMMNEVNNGNFDLTEVSLDYLSRY